MPCLHKFQSDLLLQNINFTPTRLIVGTFNPAWPATNTAQWFYGRTSNNYFWEVVPQLQNQGSLINGTPAQWKSFCSANRIAITDLISSIGSANPNNPQHVQWLSDYSDSNIAANFNGFTFVDVVQLLKNHPTINKVYLTRGATGAFWSNLWQPVAAYCAANNIQCQTLLTPSGNARFQLGTYNKNNPTNQLSLPNYILRRWQQVW